MMRKTPSADANAEESVTARMLDLRRYTLTKKAKRLKMRGHDPCPHLARSVPVTEAVETKIITESGSETVTGSTSLPRTSTVDIVTIDLGAGIEIVTTDTDIAVAALKSSKTGPTDLFRLLQWIRRLPLADNRPLLTARLKLKVRAVAGSPH
jgi:hypothetical protein